MTEKTEKSAQILVRMSAEELAQLDAICLVIGGVTRAEWVRRQIAICARAWPRLRAGKKGRRNER